MAGRPPRRLRDRYVAELATAADEAAQAGDRALAERLAHDLLRTDPFREDAYRLLMQVQQSAGNRAGALRMYHEWVSTLEREVGVRPSAETEAVHAELIAAEQPVDEPASRTGLVGRLAERDQLRRWWRDAEEGRPRLVVVEELGAWCARRGALVAESRSYPSEGELGYAAATCWLRSDDLAAQIQRCRHEDRSLIGRLLPEHAVDGGAVDAATAPDEQRILLFDTIRRAVAASGRPVLMIVDDAQWCDEQSLQLLHFLVRGDLPNALLVVATARREELDDDHRLHDLLGELHAVDRTGELVLGRFHRDETGQLLAHLDTGSWPPAAIDRLHAETEGNPLFIVEALRAGWTTPQPGSTAPVGMTPRLQAVIDGRIRQLSEPARRVLDLAATVGREFTTATLADTTGMEDLQLTRALDELWRRGFVREHGAEGYDFSHGKLRDVAYESLSPATRRRSHRVAAAALANRPREALDPFSGEIARHLDRAGDVDGAIAWYRRAAAQAQRLNAESEAVRLLGRAHELIAALPAGPARRPHRVAADLRVHDAAGHAGTPAAGDAAAAPGDRREPRGGGRLRQPQRDNGVPRRLLRPGQRRTAPRRPRMSSALRFG